MKKIYSFAKLASVAFASFFLLASAKSFGQCGPIVENFNNTGGGTAGFAGDMQLGSSGGGGNFNGFLQKTNVSSLDVINVVTPTYQLPGNSTTIGFGDSLSGSATIGTVNVTISYVSSTTGTVVTRAFATISPSYAGNGSNHIAVICVAIGTSTYPDFPVGGKYRFNIQMTVVQGNNGTGDITFDNFRTTGTLANAPLPVTFISFTAKKTSVGTQLSWQVAAEDNVNHYEVERSFDGYGYSSIASLRNPKSEKYSYLDAGAANTVYYRVKSVDNDGQYKYSNIARIVNGVESIVINAFPQPVISQLTFQHPVAAKSTTLTLSSIDGRILSTLRPATGSTQTLMDMSKLQKGMYLMRFDDGAGNVQTMKVIKQ